MKNLSGIKSNPKLDFSLRFTISIVLGSIVAAMAVAVVILAKPGKWGKADDPGEEVFIFHASEDNFYENPANWLPEYPGIHIKSNQKLLIDDLVYTTGYDLINDGTIEIGIEGTIYSFAGNITNHTEGKILNKGMLMVEKVINMGELYNDGQVDLVDYFSEKEATTYNSTAARFVAAGVLENQGTFHNYSLCSVKKQFSSPGTFYHKPNSKLLVRSTSGRIEPYEDAAPIATD